MKNYLLFITVFLCFNGLSQSLDSIITAMSREIGYRVSKKNKVKITLADFTNNEEKTDALTEYVRREMEEKLINEDNVQVMDRKHLKKLLEENHLQSQGLIDESVVKSAVAFMKIEGLVLGEITYIGDQVKIKVTVTDISTSNMYAASSSGLISDNAIGQLLDPEVKPCSECGGKGSTQIITTCLGCNGFGGQICKDCRGTGKRSGMTVSSYVSCEGCNGNGKFNCNGCSGKGKLISYQTCAKCNGKVQIKSVGTQTNLKSDAPNKIEICPDCLGGGNLKNEVYCTSCNGSGEAPFGPSSNWEKRPCRSCAGKGKIEVIKNCFRCNGTGKL